jgi:excisionase family DNA binding protein
MENCQSPETPFAYRVKEFCERIRISPSTFWKHVKLGKIRVVRIGGRVLVPATEADAILRGEAA